MDLGSTVPRRQLGRHLRQLREEARITVKVAAEELEWSAPKIWRIESGATSMRALDVEAMCRVYGASPEMTQALMGLAKETRAKGWWHSYGDAIPTWFELYVGLESAATRFRQYEPELITGSLQTEAYAKEIYRIAHPNMSATEIERGVAVRIERQALLTRTRPPAPRLEVILNEATLRRPVGEPGVMAAQLRHINEVGDLPNVSIRVHQTSAGLHRAAMAGGSFVILDFPNHGANPEPSTVYSDGLTGALYLDKPHEIAAYDEIWADAISSALTEPQSKKLIATIAKEHQSP
jgi:hypothetical protein